MALNAFESAISSILDWYDREVVTGHQAMQMLRVLECDARFRTIGAGAIRTARSYLVSTEQSFERDGAATLDDVENLEVAFDFVLAIVRGITNAKHPDVYGESVKRVRDANIVPYAATGAYVEAARKILFAEWLAGEND